MRTANTVAIMVVRVAGLILLVLGLLFWTGHALGLLNLHVLLGFVLVLALWVLAGVAARARLGAGWVVLLIVWGLVLPIVGLPQRGIMVGPAHWVIQVIHLLLGLGAMGLAERVSARARAASVA